MDKKAFDQILKNNATNVCGIDSFGYCIANRNFSEYYNKCAFDAFVDQMRSDYPAHYNKYSHGKGSELWEQGNVPPKMASVGSSSRFCYLALRNGAESLGGSGSVDFEHACPIDKIKGGTPPQMDAYLENNNIFVEVKCHEIFDSHKVALSHQYFDDLFGDDNDFGFEQRAKQDNESIEIPLSAFGIHKNNSMLDIKQLICHLLGVKSHKEIDEKATLVYLFFKPKTPIQEQQKDIENVFKDLTKEIVTVFGNENSPIRRFAKKNNIKLIAVAEYAEVFLPLTSENMIHLFP